MGDDRGDTLHWLREQAAAMAHPGQEVQAEMSRDRIQRLAYELQVHQLELQMQNEELLRTQQALESLRDRYQALFYRSPVGYLVVDGGDQIQETNAAALQILQVEGEALSGTPLGAFVTAECHDTLAQHLKDVRTGAAKACELELVRGDQSTFWAQVQTVHLKALGGTADGGFRLVTLVDVSERVHAERSLRASNRQKDQFLATLSHELRNPLAALSMASKLLSADRVDRRIAAKATAIVERQVKNMVRLIDDLLDISRITQDKIVLQVEPIDLHDLISEALLAHSASFDHAGQQVELRLPPEPVALMGDELRLSQVLSNLLDNACKYTPQGGKIIVSAEHQDDEILIQVADTGVGISADILPQLFQMFVQAPTRALGMAGLGVGLALTRRLVELHGGTIEAQSDGVNRGTSFTIRLPAAGPPPGTLNRRVEATLPPACAVGHSAAHTACMAAEIGAAAASAGQQPPRSSRRRPSAETAPNSPLKVMVVDDNQDSAQMLGVLIESWGHQVEICYSGQEALDKIGAFRPQLAILDLGMPEIDGYELARRLRAMPELNDTRLVALSGWGSEEHREQALSAGFDAHLTKPASTRTLNGLLGQLAPTKK